MKKHIVILMLMLLACFSGGCAVLPALITTGASFAVPQTASLAITAAGTVHKTVLIAADERDMDDMISDKMLTIQAQAILLAKPGADMDATCLNGDIYLVGEYATAADRDSAIKGLEELKGVNSVKGVIKQMPTSLVALVEPAIADNHAETVIEAGLFKELHIRSANIDVEVVQGEAVVMGVVRNAEEAADVIQLIEQLRPTSKTPVKVTSLLVFQESFEAHQPQMNDLFVLHTGQSMQRIPKTPQKAVVIVDKPSITSLAMYIPRERSVWQKARLNMKWHILSLSKAETDPAARRELITLSTKVLKDEHTSIEDRLIKTLRRTKNPHVRQHVDTLLSEVDPQRPARIQTLASN